MLERRAFLSGLAGLPLIGGELRLIGQPTAAAVPVTPDMLAAYDHWLFYERRMLVGEVYGHEGCEIVRAMESLVPSGTTADGFHFPVQRSWRDTPQPSTRAAVVLSAVGCPLSGGHGDGR